MGRNERMLLIDQNREHTKQKTDSTDAKTITDYRDTT